MSVTWLAVPLDSVLGGDKRIQQRKMSIKDLGRRDRAKGGESVEKAEKESNAMAGRRQSVTAQLTRQARRFSTAIAPTLTKIEPVNILQKVEQLTIRIGDIAQLQRAVEQYVMRNAVQFEPVEFDIFDRDGFRIMQASLYPGELVLQEGSKKICEISFADNEESDSCLAKIKHPVSGMTVYEMRELGGSITVQSNTDDINGCRILTQNPSWAGLLLACGCVFTKEQWTLVKQDKPLATISPQRSFFSENAIQVEWVSCCENELRLVALSFGLSQMVREAFPSLMHILREFRNRRG